MTEEGREKGGSNLAADWWRQGPMGGPGSIGTYVVASAGQLPGTPSGVAHFSCS